MTARSPEARDDAGVEGLRGDFGSAAGLDLLAGGFGRSSPRRTSRTVESALPSFSAISTGVRPSARIRRASACQRIGICMGGPSPGDADDLGIPFAKC
jgi:hypothetical protein